MTTSKRTSRRTSGARAANGTDAPSPADASDPSVAPSQKVRSRRAKSPAASATPRHREDRHASIAEAAYFRSQHRGFIPGYELEDWLAAEEEVDQRLTGEGRVS